MAKLALTGTTFEETENANAFSPNEGNESYAYIAQRGVSGSWLSLTSSVENERFILHGQHTFFVHKGPERPLFETADCST